MRALTRCPRLRTNNECTIDAGTFEGRDPLSAIGLGAARSFDRPPIASSIAEAVPIHSADIFRLRFAYPIGCESFRFRCY
jgi:hypothetical protein